MPAGKSQGHERVIASPASEGDLHPELKHVFFFSRHKRVTEAIRCIFSTARLIFTSKKVCNPSFQTWAQDLNTTLETAHKTALPLGSSPSCVFIWSLWDRSHQSLLQELCNQADTFIQLLAKNNTSTSQEHNNPPTTTTTLYAGSSGQPILVYQTGCVHKTI